MTVYVVAQLKFTNRPLYDRYQSRFMDVFKNSGGRVLAADEHPQVLEGQWDREKMVILSFADETQARGFLDSPAYREIAQDRVAGAETVSLLVRGFN
jgi:uncharacterized protein (DUF1330 family)